ncbi:IS4 family transposase [Hymenobacter sp. HDW8]|uniref:IS4 family transposase n=1 Tax=Hymenobacter sp. HDW8 TaxID=2714932 RepID=UPI0014093010|nr:IS4 family transposase [Hymenobacter sp. HDW8]QIL78458.1 IS4 family transposase [Hymenobacter sp. HDW8]
MHISTHFSDPLRWAQIHFGGVVLGDKRRTQRVQTIVAGWARQPGVSIPRLSAGQAYASKATYHLLALPQAVPDALQAAHRHYVRQHLQQEGTFLLIEDTTELIWSTSRQGRRPGLGPVGQGKDHRQGVLLHSLVAAQWPAFDPKPTAKRPTLPLLGLVDQQFYLRRPIPSAEKAAGSGRQYHLRQSRTRESDLWSQSLREVGRPPTSARWVVVADRGADVFEHLQRCQQQGLGFVVRAAQNRALVDPPTGASGGRLFTVARAQPSCGQIEFGVPARPGIPSRSVTLQVSRGIPLTLRAPQRPGRATGQAAGIPCSVVRVWEAQPPTARPGLEWILLCDTPAASFAHAHECAQQYASRWIIEDFHKALKTGLRAEKLQLQTGPRLFAAVALLSVVALALVDLRERSRVEPNRAACDAGLESTYLQVLVAQSRRPIRTVAEVYGALAALGGHLGRTSDGPPGWQTLWHGLTYLRFLVEGVYLAAQLANESAPKKAPP